MPIKYIEKQQHHIAFIVNSTANDIMVTAKINTLNNKKEQIACRALLDTCSTTNFMTETLAHSLKLKISTCHVPIETINTMTTCSKGLITATIKSRLTEYEKDISFLIVPCISPLVPDQPIRRDLINIPKNIKLADPEFHKPAPIDLLLGAGTTLSLLSVGQIHITTPNHQDLYLQKTLLGWIIGGATPTVNRLTQAKCHKTAALNFELSKFWEMEECNEPQLIVEEKLCEDHFKKHVTRTSEGRYTVALPFKSEHVELGHSYKIAAKRFENLEQKLSRNPDLRQQYHNVLNEYLTLGHMSPVQDDTLTTNTYYLPHHAVIKETSMTTKVRVVFDGSAKSSNGVSLNDALLTGPAIQSDLFSLLIRFRKYPIVLTGDIEKMYRQFLIRKEDRKFQRIIWRNKQNELQTYELNTVTFGITSAPYLAIRCLHQLAIDEGHKYLKAPRILREDFYVDDLLTGADSVEEAILIRDELSNILSSVGLTIRQWASNDVKTLQHLPSENINSHIQLGDTSTIKTLGIYWNSTTDAITYSVGSFELPPRVTKRNILSLTAKIFDPLGLLAPVIIIAKLIMQKLWILKVHWDESLPNEIHTEWQNYANELKELNDLAFPRTILSPQAKIVQLHGFSDASEKAYGACIYLRVVDSDNNIKIKLLGAKSRVAPLKSLTIPKLELCGAQLLATLMNATVTAIKMKIDNIFYWTDSTIVLHWLNTNSHQLKTFVANRVAAIQEKTKVKDWRHVRTHDNPADLISRGKTPREFLTSTIWKVGPPWLMQSIDYWPTFELQRISEVPEQRKTWCLTITSRPSTITFERFSTITKLTRTISYCSRFLQRKGTKTQLTATEISTALIRILRVIQQQEFPEEIKTLSRNQTIHSNSLHLIKLNPFLDTNGLMRVGGRLSFSELPFDSKHPVILPKNHHVTNLLINQAHRSHLHAGVQQTLYALRRKYWLIDGRSQVWKWINQCVECRKARARPANYLMGQLPAARVNSSRPFSQVGVDYCGPFILKERKFRNKNQIKAYVVVFVCMAVKAVHLELVTDLTTDGFLSTLRRFIARRGYCQDIYSDNGTNFVGANNQLKELFELFKSTDYQDKLHGYLTTRNIQWHFNPPQAPHTGGLWEAAVKSFKRHLKHVGGRDLLFTYEQFNTFIIEIEAILNSRPLTPISSDPNDPLVLTPGHLLIGDSLTNLRGRDYTNIPENRLSKWQHIQQLKQHFWKRWQREYLNELTIRNKWNQPDPNIPVGTIVLLKEDNLPPAQWALGRIIKCYPGQDGVVRTVHVKTANTSFVRNIKKLVILPVASNNNSVNS